MFSCCENVIEENTSRVFFCCVLVQWNGPSVGQASSRVCWWPGASQGPHSIEQVRKRQQVNVSVISVCVKLWQEKLSSQHAVVLRAAVTARGAMVTVLWCHQLSAQWQPGMLMKQSTLFSRESVHGERSLLCRALMMCAPLVSCFTTSSLRGRGEKVESCECSGAEEAEAGAGGEVRAHCLSPNREVLQWRVTWWSK